MNMIPVVASYYGVLNEDEEYYTNNVAGQFTNPVEEEHFANLKIGQFHKKHFEGWKQLMAVTVGDVQAVLHHHLMIHGGPWDVGENYTAIAFFHTPTIQVW